MCVYVCVCVNLCKTSIHVPVTASVKWILLTCCSVHLNPEPTYIFS